MFHERDQPKARSGETPAGPRRSAALSAWLADVTTGASGGYAGGAFHFAKGSRADRLA